MTDSLLCKIVLTVLVVKKFWRCLWERDTYTMSMSAVALIGALSMNLTQLTWARFTIAGILVPMVLWFMFLADRRGERLG